MDVGFFPSQPSSRFFNREFEKTPSPEKEGLDLESLAGEISAIFEKTAGPGGSLVVDYRAFSSSTAPRIVPGMVVDFTYLEDAYAEDVAEIEDPWTGAGGKAAADLPDLAVDKHGTVMELVHPEYIRALLKSPPRTMPITDYSIEALRRVGIKDAEQIESSARNSQLHRDIQKDIINQYLQKGYAYVSLPVTSKRYPASPGELPSLA